MKRNGVLPTVYKVLERLSRDRDEADYQEQFMKMQDACASEKQKFTHRYKISILVPTYHTKPEYLMQMMESVIQQTYDNWELCIADGSIDDTVKQTVMDVVGKYGDLTGSNRIKYQKMEKNLGISGNTNAALSMATGEYIGLLDHDDLLEKDALYEVMLALEKGLYKDGNIYSNRIMAIYSDEDKVDENYTRYFDYHRKPDFDIDLLRSNNYICHFFVVRHSLALKTGGFRSEYDGAQDHDFIFRCIENLTREEVYHIPKVLYHWRASDTSTAENPESKMYAYDAGKRAIEDHCRRMGLKVTVEPTAHLGFFRVRYLNTTGSTYRITRKQWENLTRGELEKIEEDTIMILATDLKPLTKDYLEEMRSYLNRAEVGAVGGKIYDKKYRVESAGFTRNEEGRLVANFKGLNGHYSGYMHRACLQQRVDGASFDCMMIKKEAIAGNEKLTMSNKYIVVFDPYAEFKRE